MELTCVCMYCSDLNLLFVIQSLTAKNHLVLLYHEQSHQLPGRSDTVKFITYKLVLGLVVLLHCYLQLNEACLKRTPMDNKISSQARKSC